MGSRANHWIDERGRTEKGSIMARSPNTYSPEEVRRAIQSSRKIVDTSAAALAELEIDVSDSEVAITGLDGRVTVLESSGSNAYSSETDVNVSSGQPVYMKRSN